MKNRELDPRLRRMMHSAKDDDRLRADLLRGVVAASVAVGEDTAMTPEILTTRVLVRLRSDQVPEGLSDLQWNRIVDGIMLRKGLEGLGLLH